LATGAIRQQVADRISFDEVPEAHRRLEPGGLEGKLVLCPNLGRAMSQKSGLPATGTLGSPLV
jgi:NADPH:quinone reductase